MHTNVLSIEFPCECACEGCSGTGGFDVAVMPEGDVIIDHLGGPSEEGPLASFTQEEWAKVTAFVSKLHNHDNCATCAEEAGN